jgi:hypothetical protein
VAFLICTDSLTFLSSVPAGDWSLPARLGINASHKQPFRHFRPRQMHADATEGTLSLQSTWTGPIQLHIKQSSVAAKVASAMKQFRLRWAAGCAAP